MTIGEWLNVLATKNESVEEDWQAMRNLLHKAGFPSSVVTCGIVYLDGQGQPADIHTVARMFLKTLNKTDITH
ncbi:MAG: hypothetical protein ABSG90_12180 [Dehalococcoidia bacterium]|jgi:hypothetical protein